MLQKEKERKIPTRTLRHMNRATIYDNYVIGDLGSMYSNHF